MFKIGQKGVIVDNQARHSFSNGEVVSVVSLDSVSNGVYKSRGGCYQCKSLTSGLLWYVFGTDMKPFIEDFKLEDFL